MSNEPCPNLGTLSASEDGNVWLVCASCGWMFNLGADSNLTDVVQAEVDHVQHDSDPRATEPGE